MTRPSRAGAGWASGVALGLIVAGCGGSNDPGAGTGATGGAIAAEPGQATIPDPPARADGAGAIGTGAGAPDVPVAAEPDEPGVGN